MAAGENELTRLPPGLFFGPRGGTVEDDWVAINDVFLRIPPQNIKILKKSQNMEWDTLRTEWAQKSKSGYGTLMVQMNIVFQGNDDFNGKLKPLVAGLRACPFCVVYSKYLDQNLRGLEVGTDPTAPDTYQLFKPLALAVSSMTISTVPSVPDALSVDIVFYWFNYYPYMSQWVYKTGAYFDTPGTVFDSDLWPAFYVPYMSDKALNWPHPVDSPDHKTFLYIREFTSAPAVDRVSNQAVQDMLDLLKNRSDVLVTALTQVSQNPSLKWTDENFWDVAYKQIGKEALDLGKNVNTEMRERMAATPEDSNMITQAVERTGTGDLLREAFKTRFSTSDTTWESRVSDAILALKKTEQDAQVTERIKDLTSGEIEKGPDQEASKYVKLNTFSIRRPIGTGNDAKKVGTDVYGRKRRLELSPDKGFIIEGISVTFSFNLTSIPMANYRYPTMQYTGGNNVEINMSLNCTNHAAAKLNTFYDSMENSALKYRMIPAGFLNMVIKNDLLNFLGIQEVITQNLLTETQHQQPGRSAITLELTTSGVTSTDKPGSVEKLNQEQVWTDTQVLETIADKLHKTTLQMGDAYHDMNWKDEKAWFRTPGIPPTNTKTQGFSTLSKRYCDIFNQFVQDTFHVLYAHGGEGAPTTANRKEIYTEARNQYGDVATTKYGVGIIGNTQLQQNKQQADQGAEASKNAGSADISLLNYLFFMQITTRDPIFGLVPNIKAVQDAVTQRDKFLGNLDLIPDGQSVQTSSRQGMFNMMQQANRIKNMLGDSPEIRALSEKVAKDAKAYQDAFSFVFSYKNALRTLLDEIMARWLELPEFKGIYDMVKSRGLQQGSLTYYDFQKQIGSCVSYIRTATGEEISEDLTLYNPDLYLYNPTYDGGVANPDNGALLQPDLLTQAAALSMKSWQSATSEVGKWFQTNYWERLDPKSNTRTEPGLALLKQMKDIDDYSNQPRNAFPFRHSMYAPRKYNNYLRDNPVKKELSCDYEQHAHTHQAKDNTDAMTSDNLCITSTNFPDYWGTHNVGNVGPAPAPSGSGSSSGSPATPPPGQNFTQKQIVDIVSTAAQQNGVNPQFALAFALLESGLNPNAKSPTGYIGLFQAGKSWWKEYGQGGNIWDPKDNATAGARSLKSKDGSTAQGRLSAYLTHNQGAGGSAAIQRAAQGSGTLSAAIKKNILVQGIPGINSSMSDKTLAQSFLSTIGAIVEKKYAQAGVLLASGGSNNMASKPNLSQPSASLSTSVTATAVKPLELAMQEFEKELATGQAASLSRAYPAFKLYFIEDDQSERRFGFDDFFSYSAVQSIRIVRDRHIAADLCELYLTNVSGMLSNRRFTQDEDGGVYARGPDGKPAQQNYDAMAKDTKFENPITSLLLRPDAHFSVYLGYSNNPAQLELVFTGVITEIEFSGSDDMVRVLGQSYGVELVQDIKGFAKPQELTSHSWMNFNFWGFRQGASTGKILEEMLGQEEVVHFGRWNSVQTQTNANRDLLTNKWQYQPKPYDDNIFAPTASDEIKDFADDILFKDLHYVIYQTTIWDIAQEMTLRHPNHIAAVVPYKAINTDRATFFFGLPHGLYFARDPNFEEQNKVEALKKAQTDAATKANVQTAQQHKESWWGKRVYYDVANQVHELLKDHPKIAGMGYNQPGAYGWTFSHKASGNEETKLNAMTNQRLSFAKQAGLIKPFRAYHLLTSGFHIVANNIQANSRDVANSICVRYNTSPDATKRYSNGSDALALENLEEEITVKLDAALPPEMTRTQTVGFTNVTNPNLAKRYAIAMLLRNTKDIYRGEIVVLGNPKIKPHDVCYVLDEYSDMIGPIEVDRVVHVFSQDQGFLTEIKPSMLAQAGEWTMLHNAEAMGVVMEGAAKWMFNEGQQMSGLDQTITQWSSKMLDFMSPVIGYAAGYFGGFMADAILHYTQMGYPLVLSPMTHHGRIFSGGVPTSKLPKSMWKCIFGEWTPQASQGFDMWVEDKIHQIAIGLEGIAFQWTQGPFWNQFNELKVE